MLSTALIHYFQLEVGSYTSSDNALLSELTFNYVKDRKWFSCRGYHATNITPHRPCSQDKAMPNKNPWESYNPACEYQNYATMNVLESDTKDSLEMTPAEWEKCVNLPLDVQEGDFQTEV